MDVFAVFHCYSDLKVVQEQQLQKKDVVLGDCHFVQHRSVENEYEPELFVGAIHLPSNRHHCRTCFRFDGNEHDDVAKASRRQLDYGYVLASTGGENWKVVSLDVRFVGSLNKIRIIYGSVFFKEQTYYCTRSQKK